MPTRLRLIDNPPGLAAIACRIGDHALLRRQLLAGLATRPALASLTTRSPSDPTLALLDAWACAAAVLTFYQERLAHESYLRTADERLSVHHLARLVGYELDPGIAAETSLALTADPLVTAGAPVRVEPGLRAQSVAPGQPAQIFETTEPLELRAAWNELRPAPTAPRAQTRSLLLAAPLATLHPPALGGPRGPLVLIAGSDDAAPRDLRILLTYDAVEELPGRTRVTWTDALAPPPAPRVHLLRRSGPLTPYAPDKLRLEVDAPTPFVVIADTTRAELYPRTTLDVSGDHIDVGLDLAGRRAPADFTAPARVYNDPLELLVEAASPADDRLWLRGAQPNLRPGDPVLLVADDDQGNWRLAIVRALEPDPARNLTAAVLGLRLPRWQPPLPANLRAYALRQRAALFGQNAPDPQLVAAPPGSTAISTPPSGAPAWTDFDVPDPAIDLDNTYPAAVPGDPVFLVRGDLVERFTITRARAISRAGFGLSARVTRLTAATWPGSAARFPRRDTEVLLAPEPLTLADPPDDSDVAGDSLTLAGAHPLPPGRRLLLTGTTLAGVPATEPVRCAAAQILGDRTRVELTPPLQNTYRRGSVALLANVVRATHGERVDEVLGDGDPSLAFQTFALRAAPLTHTFSEAAAARVSTLELRVDGQPWREVQTLFAAGPHDRVFTVRADEHADIRVQFGDGTHGARLPAGRGNVRASYRRGTGLAGQVPAHTITSLLARPVGVGRVDNPLPARGAADLEDTSSARRRAPGSVRTLGRVISLSDYAEFARAFPGVAKAHAIHAVDGLTRRVSLTIAGRDGAAILPDDPVWIGLRAALRAAGDAQVLVHLRPAAVVPFELGGTITRDRSVLESTLRADLESALRARFGFDARDFGQPVYSSELLAAIQSVPGVLGVDLDVLRRPASQIPHSDRLTARVGLEGPGELLVLDLSTLAAFTVIA